MTEQLITLMGRAVMCAAYVLLAFGLCHDGTSAGDFAGLLTVGAVFVVFSSALGWILRGPGQVDRES